MRILVVLAIISVGLLANAPVTAAESATDILVAVEQCDRQARTLQQQRAFDDALQRIDDCLQQLPQQPQLLLRRAMVRYDMDWLEQALESYEQALQAGLEGPDQRKARTIIHSLQPVREHRLRLIVENGPAEVYVRHRSYGVRCVAAPTCSIGRLPGRKYWVRVERKGFHPYEGRLALQSATKVRLRELPSKLNIEVWPEHAHVMLNDLKLGRGRQQRTMEPGDAVVKISAPGFATVERTVTARLGRDVSVRVALPELVSIALSPVSARVHLDGEPIAIDDGVLRLPPGKQAHLLRARARGYHDEFIELSAERPSGHRVEFKLMRSSRSLGHRLLLGGLSATSLAAFATSAGLTASASRQAKAARPECETDAESGFLCPPPAYEQLQRASLLAGRAELALAVGAGSLVGALWSLNVGERGRPRGEMSFRRKLSIGIDVSMAAAGLGVGGLYLWRARERRQASAAESCQDTECENRQTRMNTRARQDMQTARLGFTVAGVAATGAAILWWTAPEALRSRAPAGLVIGPDVATERVGIRISGRL